MGAKSRNHSRCRRCERQNDMTKRKLKFDEDEKICVEHLFNYNSELNNHFKYCRVGKGIFFYNIY